MKKIIITICGLVIFLTGYYFSVQKQVVDLGGSKNVWEIDTKLKLKADKAKILSYEVLKEYKVIKVPKLMGAIGDATTTASSTDISTTTDEIIEAPQTPTSTVEYKYISDVIATATPYFANGENFSRAEYLPTPGKTTIQFYSEEKWALDKPNVVNILEATTTLEAFNGQIAKTNFDKVLDIFGYTANATTSYTATGTTSYNPGSAGTVNVLVVAGGGSGGGGNAGGGGGGEVKASSSYPVIAQDYSVTVGSGGTRPAASNDGNNGATSTFGTLSSVGGGGGGRGETLGYHDGKSGGSGGGGGGGSAGRVGGASFASGGGFGKPGGPSGCSGGGGGATATGTAGVAPTAGNGGQGYLSDITGTALRYGSGGGGAYTNNGVGADSCGGNGDDFDANNGSAGLANRGCGGGGASGGTNIGYEGGSGIVILQFTASGEGGTVTPVSNILIFE